MFANAFVLCIEPVIVEGEVRDCRFRKNTLMDATAPFQRILHFSNPEVDYMGIPTGTEVHNNALMVSSTVCHISGFRDISSFTAFGSGPTNISHDDEAFYLYSSYYWGCVDGPVTYHWEISWDHQSTFQDLSDSPHEEHAILDGADIPINEYGQLSSTGYIRFTATCVPENVTRCHIITITN